MIILAFDKNIDIPTSKFALIVPGGSKVDPIKEYQSSYTKKSLSFFLKKNKTYFDRLFG